MRIPSNLLSNVTTIILSPQFLQNLLPSDNGHVHKDAPKWAKLSGQGDFNLLGVGNPDRDGDRDARRMLVMIYDIYANGGCLPMNAQMVTICEAI